MLVILLGFLMLQSSTHGQFEGMLRKSHSNRVCDYY